MCEVMNACMQNIVRMNTSIIWLQNNAADDKININHPTTRTAYTHK